MRQKISALAFYILVVAALSGCGSNSPFRKHITEGTIEFDVTYPEIDSNNLMLEMLPDRMVMKFKDDHFKSTLTTAAGIVEMGVIADSKKRTMYNMAKIFSDRYILKMNEAQAREFSDVFPPFQLSFMDEWTQIADANCEKVLIDFGTGKPESYLFYYTNEIGLEDPNWFTPYSEIKGVLLDYYIENYGMVMHLKATEIIPGPVEDSEFEVDKRYREVNATEFDDIVVKNMELFLE